ncbi:MAG: hypothetical protein JWQ77_1702 [Jatrophihabitans sp.]|nr:hypothetical protein [Jatrophihabitans sp.]
MLWTLRQRRYLAIAAGMLAVAIGCVAAGTWQISRFEQSVHDNRALDHNARAASVPLTTALVPLSGTAKNPGRLAVRFRSVSAEGSYLAGTQYLTGKIDDNVGGYYAVSPLRTAGGVVLVVRGFVADDGHGGPLPVAAAPSGTVHVTGRLDTASTGGNAVDPATQAARLGLPVYEAQLNLLAGQPGTSGLKALPKPNLSNPAGGAYEAQHFAYIIQWYLFALIALVTPFALSRNEVRDAQRRFLGIDPGEEELSTGTGIALRENGAVVRPGEVETPAVRRAQRLADRYGRSLTDGNGVPQQLRPPPMPVLAPEPGGLAARVPDSSEVPHRSHDAYHGSYNDYLWRLGLEDGESRDLPLDELPVIEIVEPDEHD